MLTGISVVTIGMGMFTQISADTPYLYIVGALFVMGLGMPGTMMPIMSAALATLSDHNIARGSTFLNINQQVAASIGTALFSVLLTNGFKDSPAIRRDGAATALADQPAKLLGAACQGRALPRRTSKMLHARALVDMADAFSTVFIVATIQPACRLISAFFLPRKKAERVVEPAAMVGHRRRTSSGG